LEDFEQELVDQYCLAAVGAGLTDGYIARERAAVFRFARHLGDHLWTAAPDDGDRYLAWARRDVGWAHSTIEMEAGCLSRFYEFVIERYQGDIHALTGRVVIQPIDEFNRPAKSYHMPVRVPPREQEVALLFDNWRNSLPHARKFLPAARDYLAACASPKPCTWTSATGGPTSAATANCTSASAKAAEDEDPRRGSCPRSTTSTHSSTGGSATSATNSARTGRIPTRRCCPANGGPETPARAAERASTHCGPDSQPPSLDGFPHGPVA
jgi:hypothetical protein